MLRGRGDVNGPITADSARTAGQGSRGAQSPARPIAGGEQRRGDGDEGRRHLARLLRPGDDAAELLVDRCEAVGVGRLERRPSGRLGDPGERLPIGRHGDDDDRCRHG